MVVLAASITTTSGKPLLSRQFKDLSKDRVMELLSNFQNLVSTISSDHTFVEDRHVRYVYKPFDEFYIILITNRQSNIIQDLATLNLFSQTINSFVTNFDEYEIYDNAFEILSSFDEIICMGYKENLNSTQVSTFLSMESHTEKIQEIIERNKEMEATEERKRRAKEIARKEQDRKNGIISPEGLMGESGSHFASSNDPNVRNAYNSYYGHSQAAAKAQSVYTNKEYTSNYANYDPFKSNLGKPTNTMLVRNQSASGNINANTSATDRFIVNGSKIQYLQFDDIKPENKGILLSVNETINASFNRDGSIQSSELKGVFEVRVNDSELADLLIKLDDSVNVKDRTFQFKSHPNIDKNQFLNEKLISLKDKTKNFPHNDQSLGVLRWRKVGKADDTSLVPIELSTWVTPNSSGDSFDVTIEFEINQDLQDMKIENLGFIIPIPIRTATINEDNNDFNASILEINDEVGIVIKIGSPLESNQTGSVSLSVPGDMEDALFPIDACFTINEHSISGINIDSVTKRDNTTEAYSYDLIRNITTDEYIIM